MMGQAREFRLVFFLVFGIWFVLAAAEAGMWSYLQTPNLAAYDWGTYGLLSTLARAAAVAAMVILLIALYRHLAQPRPLPVRPTLGLLVALVGVLLSLVSIGFLGGVQGAPYTLVVALSFFSFPLFLFGVGLMFLLEPPPEAAPVRLLPQAVPAPQAAPPQPAAPGNREITSGPWGPP